MNAMATEIKAAVPGKDFLQEICSELMTFFEQKGREEGLDYFKTLLQEMSPYDWVDEVTQEFLNFDIVSKKRISELMRLINTLMVKQIGKRVSEEDFYTDLWARVWDDIVLPTHEDRAAFLQILWSDARIPYFQISEGCSIPKEEFERIVEKIQSALRKGEFIVNANISYKSQQASLLMEIANSLDGDEERIVFWGILIGNLRAEIGTLRSMLSEKEADEEH